MRILDSLTLGVFIHLSLFPFILPALFRHYLYQTSRPDPFGPPTFKLRKGFGPDNFENA